MEQEQETNFVLSSDHPVQLVNAYTCLQRHLGFAVSYSRVRVEYIP